MLPIGKLNNLRVMLLSVLHLVDFLLRGLVGSAGVFGASRSTGIGDASSFAPESKTVLIHG